MAAMLSWPQCVKPQYDFTGTSSINSLWPSDAIMATQIWVNIGSGNGLVPLVHYLNQWLLLIREVLWHSPESNFTASAQAAILYNVSKNYTFKITAISPRVQWVKILHCLGTSEANMNDTGNRSFWSINSLIPVRCSCYLKLVNFPLQSRYLEHFQWNCHQAIPGGRFKNTYELLNLRALKFSHVNKIHIFQCMGKIFCVEFQRYPLKFHTKYLAHTLKDLLFIQHRNFKSSYI